MSYRGAHRQPAHAHRRAVDRVVAVAGATAVLASVVAVGAAAPSNAGAPYTASGRLARYSTGIGVTDSEFAFATCPDMPSTQGEDGYVFALPADVAVAGARLEVTGSPSAYVLHGYTYDAACVPGDSVSGTAGRVATDLTGTQRFFSVYTTTIGLAAVTLTLTVTPPGGGSTGDPTSTATVTPTATATATATPTATATAAPVTRGTYPVKPDDPLFAQLGENNLLLPGQWGMRKIQAPQAWQEKRATGAGIKVAVIDSGLDLDHEDFACPGKLHVVPNSDPDPDGRTLPTDDEEGHGTHVAGIVGACTNNGKGVVGVAPDSTIVPIQGLSSAVTDTVGTLAGAIDTAVASGAHVVNMSLGFGATGHVGSAAYLTSNTYAPIEAAVERAVAAGVVVVAAAGNDDNPLCGFPAIAEDVVCVGATDKRDLKSWYSSFPVKLDADDTVGPALVAPGGSGEQLVCDFSGEDIVSTYDVDVDTAEDDCDGNLGYHVIEGTSMASPHVAGVAALVYDRIGGARSGENGRKVVEALLNTAVDLYGAGYDPLSGYGRLDALAAVRYFPAAADPTPTPTGTTTSPTQTPTPTPTAQPTATAFTAVPAGGQFSDDVALEARLTDAAGNGVAGETLTFQLLGRDGFRQVAAVTDAGGVARATLRLDAAPGTYELSAGYAGKPDTWRTSAARQAFAVEREDTVTTLVPSGSGSKRTLAATVADADTAARRVAGVVVTFYADGVKAGEAVTDATGTATFTPPPGSRGSSTAYEAVFAGDAYHLGSAASAA